MAAPEVLVQGRQEYILVRRLDPPRRRMNSGRAGVFGAGEARCDPSVRTVDVARRECGGEAVGTLVEEEERVRDGLEVAVVGRWLLRPGHRTLGAVDIELSER